MTDHKHDLVRVEDEQNGQAWETCKTCQFRTSAEPWTPPVYTEDQLAEMRARAADDAIERERLY